MSIEEARATCMEAIASIDAGWTEAPTKDEQKAVDAADAYALAVLEEATKVATDPKECVCHLEDDPAAHEYCFAPQIRARIEALGTSAEASQ